jgi:hypothetical protein
MTYENFDQTLIKLLSVLRSQESMLKLRSSDGPFSENLLLKQLNKRYSVNLGIWDLEIKMFKKGVIVGTQSEELMYTLWT